jgi:hypothetical protein
MGTDFEILKIISKPIMCLALRFHFEITSGIGWLEILLEVSIRVDRLSVLLDLNIGLRWLFVLVGMYMLAMRLRLGHILRIMSQRLQRLHGWSLRCRELSAWGFLCRHGVVQEPKLGPGRLIVARSPHKHISLVWIDASDVSEI